MFKPKKIVVLRPGVDAESPLELIRVETDNISRMNSPKKFIGVVQDDNFYIRAASKKNWSLIVGPFLSGKFVSNANGTFLISQFTDDTRLLMYPFLLTIAGVCGIVLALFDSDYAYGFFCYVLVLWGFDIWYVNSQKKSGETAVLDRLSKIFGRDAVEVVEIPVVRPGDKYTLDKRARKHLYVSLAFVLGLPLLIGAIVYWLIM